MRLRTVGCVLIVVLALSMVICLLTPKTFYADYRTIVIAEPNFTDVVAQSIKSVVHIKCPQWQGSGFVISKHIIATARHVVEGVEDFEITFSCGNRGRATKAISNKKYDIGFIWVDYELPDWMIVEFGSVKDCILGQDVYAIGSPYGTMNFNSLTKGIISGLDRTYNFQDRSGNDYGWEISFTTDTAAHPGNSGCPVFTLDGKVRGVIVGGFSPVLVVVMPVDIFINDIEQIKLMFLMDKYQFEEEPEHEYPYYNYENDNDYY